MEKKNIYGLFLILAVFVTSCELPNNIDPKNSMTVSPNALFTKAEIALVDQVAELDYNNSCSRFLAQGYLH
jgi:PBP1b-binding outer membrane lipoprotein LpoB